MAAQDMGGADLSRGASYPFAPSPWLRYAVAAASVVIGWLAREALVPVLGPTARPFITFFPVVAVTAWYGGLGPGLVSTVLAALIADRFFILPVRSFALQSSIEVASIITFVVGCGFIVGAFETLHRARSRLARENGERLRSEAQLAKSRDLLVTILTSIGDGVIITDAEGRVTFLNTEAERLTGWSGAQAQD